MATNILTASSLSFCPNFSVSVFQSQRFSPKVHPNQQLHFCQGLIMSTVSLFSLFWSLFCIHWPLITVRGKVGKLLSVGTQSGQHSHSEPVSLMPRPRPGHRPLLTPGGRPGPGSRPPRLQILAWFLASHWGKVWWLLSRNILHEWTMSSSVLMEI